MIQISVHTTRSTCKCGCVDDSWNCVKLVLGIHPFGQELYVLMSLTKWPGYLSVHIAFCVGNQVFMAFINTHVVFRKLSINR